jgi:HEAT repeat protein
MDHLADHRCLAALEEATADPSSDVRRHAAHALACQQCKPAPLDLDVLGLLLKLASEDRSIRVRRVATASLVLQPPSRRAATVLRMSGQVASDQR